MERISDIHISNDTPKKTASGEKSPGFCAVMSNLNKRFKSTKIGRSAATVGLVTLEDEFRKSTAGPSEKNTRKGELPKSKDPIGISPIKATTSEEHTNDQARTISGKPPEPKKHRFSKLAPKGQEKTDCSGKRKVGGKTEKETSTPQVKNVSVDSKSSKDGQKKNLDVHASNVDVKPAIGNCSAANSSSAVSDAVNSTLHMSDLERYVAREIRARIAKAVSRVVESDTFESEVQTEVPGKNHQKEPSEVGFDQCVAALIGSILMESKEKVMGQLNSTPDRFPTGSNSATEMMEDVFKSIVDSVFNGNTLSPGESAATEADALFRPSLNRACKRILKSVFRNAREDWQMGKDEASLLTTITKKDEDILDADHEPIGQQKHAIKKPDSIRGPRPERLSILRPHAKRRQAPPVKRDEKEHRSSKGGKRCGYSAAVSQELNYLFRPAPGVPPPLPRRCFVGEVGWSIEHGFKFGSKDLRSGHQFKRTGCRLEMEDRLSQIFPDPWQAPAHSLDREEPSAPENWSVLRNQHSDD